MGILDKKFVAYPMLALGYIQYLLQKKTNYYSYLSFRSLYGQTQGKINQQLSAILAEKKEGYEFTDQPENPPSILPYLDSQRISQIVSNIDQKGYYVFPELVPEEICNELLSFAKATPSQTVPLSKGNEYVIFDKGAPKATMYKFKETDLVENKRVLDFLFDINFLRIAQQYLGSQPINDLLVMWWSSPFSSQASSEAAQLFHYDMDRLKFIKVFLYLTDVGLENGPHVYVEGSHKEKPAHLYENRRFKDEEVEQFYGKGKIKEIGGKKGTLFIADTSGIHKGKNPEKGTRLIFQMEYTNSLFGQQFNRIPGLGSHLSKAQKNFMSKFPAIYQRFL